MKIHDVSKSLGLALGLSTVLIMSGCSKDDDNDSTGGDTGITQSAYFIDSAVEGIDYECLVSGKKGVTDVAGKFDYLSGDECTFKVGNTTLGSANPSTEFFTPQNLTTVEPNLTNILRYLQTLDTDTTDDKITLPTSLSDDTVSFGSDFNTSMTTLLSNSNLPTTIVSPDDANAHFKTTQVKLMQEAFKNKHISFADDEGSVGDYYLFTDGTLTHDTADGSDSDIPGVWSIDADAKLVINVNQNGDLLFAFDLIPPVVGTLTTVSGLHSGTVELTVLDDFSLSVANGFTERNVLDQNIYLHIVIPGEDDEYGHILLGSDTKVTFLDESVDPAVSREGYIDTAIDGDTTARYTFEDGKLIEHLMEEGSGGHYNGGNLHSILSEEDGVLKGFMDTDLDSSTSDGYVMYYSSTDLDPSH